MGRLRTRTVVINLDRRFFNFFVSLLLAGLAVWAILGIFPYSSIILYPLLRSSLLSIVLNPLVMKLENSGLARTPAVALVILLFLLVVIALLFFLVPVVEKQLQDIFKFLQQTSAADIGRHVELFLEKNLSFLKGAFRGQIAAKIAHIYGSLFESGISFLPSILNFIIMLILIPFMSFFILKDGKKIKRKLIEMIPNRLFEPAISLFYKVNSQISNYFLSQFLVALCVGVLSFLLLLLFKVPYAALIALAAGIFNIIPYLGPIIGGLLAAAINFLEKGSFSSVLDVLIIFALVRMADDFVFTPNIMARGVKLHPILVIAAIFIGGEMFGFWGLLFAIPALAVMKVTVSEIFYSMKRYRF